MLTTASARVSPWLTHALLSIRDRAGVTMILAEQKVDFALAFAEDALVLERGRIAFRGRTAELREDEALQHRLLAIGKL
jgi:branched-chain amino acid transport system ATP-binding protein